MAAALTAVALAAGSTVALATMGGAFGHRASTGARCTAPRPAGTSVDVTLADMGGGMMGRPAGSGAMMSGGRRATARVFVSPSVVPAGRVSLRVVNAGVQPHELVVLPLPAAQAAGVRTIGAGGQVDEAGSLGEVSRSCGAGVGDGISAGATGWATLTLESGRYELVCNLPGHYAAGMYAELTVA